MVSRRGGGGRLGVWLCVCACVCVVIVVVFVVLGDAEEVESGWREGSWIAGWTCGFCAPVLLECER